MSLELIKNPQGRFCYVNVAKDGMTSKRLQRLVERFAHFESPVAVYCDELGYKLLSAHSARFSKFVRLCRLGK